MFKLIKQTLCKHDYRFVTKYKEDVSKGVAFKLADINVAYCPKCGSTKRMETPEFELLMFKQKVARKKK